MITKISALIAVVGFACIVYFTGAVASPPESPSPSQTPAKASGDEESQGQRPPRRREHSPITLTGQI